MRVKFQLMPNKRKVILINKKFQLLFSFYFCSWLFALSLAYPLMVYQLFEVFVGYAALDPNGPALAMLEEARQQMIWMLVAIQLTFLLITFMITVFLSHRIAGPIYKLGKFMREGATGRLQPGLRFRKADHFQELAQDYNQMAAAISENLQRISAAAMTAVKHVEAAISSTDGSSRQELEKALSQLKQIHQNTAAPGAG